MPCDSSHMEASGFEIEMSRVLALLKELKTGKAPEAKEWQGYGEGYSRHFSHEEADKLVAELCGKLGKADVTKYSLEMQMWWRDHLEWDAARIKREKEEAAQAEAKKKALEKLSPAERKALGL